MSKKSKRLKDQFSPPRRRRAWLLTALLLIILAVGSLLALKFAFKHTTYVPPRTINAQTKGDAANNTTSSNDKKSSPPPASPSTGADTPYQSPKTGSGTSVTGTLLVPTGPFVSNHHPNLSGSPAPNTMHSVCNTSPSASCAISFTNGSTVKTLPAKTTDTGGATYWDWRLQDLGLTAGEWTIQAHATSTGQSKDATDPLNLEIQP